MTDMKVYQVPGGYIVHGDSTDPYVMDEVRDLVPCISLVIADPPYGNIVMQDWDRVDQTATEFSEWMLDWCGEWAARMEPGGAMYVWGGYGKPGFRPYFRFLHEVEQRTPLQMANYITWAKKRAYGIQWGYLETREDVVYLVNGDRKKPRAFNIPLLDQKRGYAGYNAKYPAKSEYLRRTSVWTDITEIFRGKEHPTQKQQRLHEVMIETSSLFGDWVIDPFAGYGTTGFAARTLGRSFVLIENDTEYVRQMLYRML